MLINNLQLDMYFYLRLHNQPAITLTISGFNIVKINGAELLIEVYPPSYIN